MQLRRNLTETSKSLISSVSSRSKSRIALSGCFSVDSDAPSRMNCQTTLRKLLDVPLISSSPITPAQHLSSLAVTGFDQNSTRGLSTEAICALSHPQHGDNFISGACGDIMLNPFLSKISNQAETQLIGKNGGIGADDGDFAFLKLFNVISTLNRQTDTVGSTETVANIGIDNSITTISSIINSSSNIDNALSTEKLFLVLGKEECDSAQNDNKPHHETVAGASGGDETDQPVDKNETQIIKVMAGTTESEGLHYKIEKAMRNSYIRNRHTEYTKNMRAKSVEDLMLLFHQSQIENTPLNDDTLEQMIQYLARKDIMASFDILKYYVDRLWEEGKLVRLSLYRNVMRAIRKENDVESVGNLIQDMFFHIKSYYVECTAENKCKENTTEHQHTSEKSEKSEKYCESIAVYQHILLPELLREIVSHKTTEVSTFATPIIEYIISDQFPVIDLELYEGILENASLEKVFFIPYHAIITYLVWSGCKPRPKAVMNALSSHHPFHDTGAIFQILQCILKLHQDRNSSTMQTTLPISFDRNTPDNTYQIDIGTLEAISLASTKHFNNDSGTPNVELNLLLWDLVESFHQSTTSCMFEDVILSFASTPMSDAKVFGALADMAKQGYFPSRTLLKKIAGRLSLCNNRLSHAYQLLTGEESDEDSVRSTDSMNALLLGYGIKRDINSCFCIFDDFSRYDLRPDANTFSFLMECLYLDIKSRFLLVGKKTLESSKSIQSNQNEENILGALHILVSSMEVAGISPNDDFIYQQIRILCALNKMDDAKAILYRAIEDCIPVDVRSIVMIATKFAGDGDFVTARSVVGLCVEAGCGRAPSHVFQRIEMLFRQSRGKN